MTRCWAEEGEEEGDERGDDLVQILVRRCYLGLLTHRVAIGQYVGVGGEHHVKARIGARGGGEGGGADGRLICAHNSGFRH
eukprot:265945-Hanusia_phi.AAC.1